MCWVVGRIRTNFIKKIFSSSLSVPSLKSFVFEIASQFASRHWNLLNLPIIDDCLKNSASLQIIAILLKQNSQPIWQFGVCAWLQFRSSSTSLFFSSYFYNCYGSLAMMLTFHEKTSNKEISPAKISSDSGTFLNYFLSVLTNGDEESLNSECLFFVINRLHLSFLLLLPLLLLIIVFLIYFFVTWLHGW